MKRVNQNFIVDSIAFVAFVFLTSTGILMRFLLPPGSGHSRSLLGLSRHGWGDVHFWVALLFLAILALHLLLHWRWIVCVITGRKREYSGKRLALGLFGFLGVIALSLVPLLAPVDNDSGLEGAAHRQIQTQANPEIHGSMSLEQIMQNTGTPLAFILQRLSLDDDISTNQGIAKLGRKHGFTVSDVRNIVNEFQKQQVQEK